MNFLHGNKLLHTAQHGFTAGRSTLTNLLQFDAYIADCVAAGHPYDVITFDFCKAFEKVPLLISFFTHRTQQVKMGSCLSKICDVTSGVMQGSVLGPDLYVIATNSLLAAINLPCGAFADDIKFAANVIKNTRNTIQDNINIVADWAKEHHMPLSTEKSFVMHCGKSQANHDYTLEGHPMKCVDSIVDLGVVRSSNSSYSDQCQAVAAKAARTANIIRRAFCTGDPKLLWPAYQIYVSPVLMYCSPIWSPNMQHDVTALERVQRRFTKSIRGLHELSYTDRLRTLGTLTLQHRRLYADMITVFKTLHGLTNCSPQSIGLSTSTSNTRGGGVRLCQRRAVSKIHSSLFCCRVPTVWNKLPLDITNCQSLPQFKLRLHKFLIMKQHA
jgi:hypothetical protein